MEGKGRRKTGKKVSSNERGEIYQPLCFKSKQRLKEHSGKQWHVSTYWFRWMNFSLNTFANIFCKKMYGKTANMFIYLKHTTNKWVPLWKQLTCV